MSSVPKFETLLIDAASPIGHLTLNRPDKLNPLSTRTLRELAEAARWFDTQRHVKVVIVSGAGRAFSAGADISGFGNPDSNDGLNARDAAETGSLWPGVVSPVWCESSGQPLPASLL